MGERAPEGDDRWTQLPRSYDVVADLYAAQFDDELDGKPRDRALLTELAAAVSDPVIDLGCGPGQIGAVPLDAGRHVIGLDLSEGMAQRAGRRLHATAVADMRALPLADASVGGVVAFYSVIHVQREELGGVLEEIARVLRPGGRVLLSAHEGEGRIEVDELLGQPVPFVATLFTLDELVAATEAAGLEIVVAERREPYATEHPTSRLYLAAERPQRHGTDGTSSGPLGRRLTPGTRRRGAATRPLPAVRARARRGALRGGRAGVRRWC